jgi:hypothetical protein
LTAGFHRRRAAAENISNQINRVADIDIAVTVGVSYRERIRGGATAKNIADKKDSVTNVNSLISIRVPIGEAQIQKPGGGGGIR